MMFRLVHEYPGDEELQRIAGISPGLPTSQAEIQGAYDFAVKLDVRELDSDYVIGKMKAIIDLLPIDTAGTVDRAKLMSIAVSMVDPVLGQSVMSDQRGASQKTFDKVNQDVALMALRNEAARYRLRHVEHVEAFHLELGETETGNGGLVFRLGFGLRLGLGLGLG